MSDDARSLWLHGLELENIGPFPSANLSFCHDDEEPAPVVLFTGQSGTGKTIVLDAIRQSLSAVFSRRNVHWLHDPAQWRAILRRQSTSGACAVHLRDGVLRIGYSTPPPAVHPFNTLVHQYTDGAGAWVDAVLSRVVLEFWDTSLPGGSFVISNFSRRGNDLFHQGAFEGRVQAQSITDLICQFDYLRSSDDDEEKRTGEALMAATRKIAELAMLEGGRFVRVERSTFTPLFEQAGSVVSIDQLSAGNTYLVSRLLTLLGHMHSAQVVNRLAPEEMLLSPGLLIIDEVEAHLHPRWQSRVLPGIRRLFPNVQIIATTHSPFVLASAPDAKVFTTRLRSERDACEIIDSTRDYTAMPIDAILASEAFDCTLPFGPEIAKLFSDRMRALNEDRFDDARAIEDKLIALSPDYFAWMKLRPARPLEGAAE